MQILIWITSMVICGLLGLIARQGYTRQNPVAVTLALSAIGGLSFITVLALEAAR